MLSARKIAALTGDFAGTARHPVLARRCVGPLHAPLILLVLPLVAATGCFHHQPPPPPPVASNPPALPGSMTTIPPAPPSMPAPSKPDVALTESRPAPAVVPPIHTHRAVHKKRPTDSSAPATPATATITPSTPPAASATATPGESPAASASSSPRGAELGQLSAGNSADTKELSSMIEQIHTLEIRLANLKHSQSSDEEATEVQIRLFLSKARQATLSNDLDGARTLALKAKVLLDELTNL